MTITTNLDWKDLVISDICLSQIQEIKSWVTHRDTLEKDTHLKRWIKPGYRVLFYGPPGIGKTLTATLIGKSINKPVYRVDLSVLVSKYIGETEKNLSRIFDEAKSNDAILFFDEADALFGKRTKATSSNYRYANQEVSYLLQRIEDFDGLVILSSNVKNNIDDAFTRRFQSIIHFPMPNSKERFQLWKNIFSESFQLEEDLIRGFAENYELTGGEIVNILQVVAIQKESEKADNISKDMLMHAIKKEFKKHNRSI